MTMGMDGITDVKSKVALVFGASRGIGAAIARLLAHHGADVLVVSRKLEACASVVDEIVKAGGHAEAFACNLSNLEEIEALYALVDERKGRLDILVNCAAANPYFGSIIDTTVEGFQKTVDTNIRGFFFSSAMGAKLMAKGRGGSIINVSSIYGRIPGRSMGIYSITKGAILTMTQAFANECAELGVRVNAVLPGLTETRFSKALIDDQDILSQSLNRIPLRRAAQPDEIAGAVLYLASPASSYATGSCITVDGGLLSN